MRSRKMSKIMMIRIGLQELTQSQANINSESEGNAL